MLLIGLQNPTSQAVLADGLITLGSTYRKFDTPNECGTLAFDTTATSITLNRKGIYHVTATFYPAAAFAGTITLNINGTPTTAIANGENLTIDYYVIVDCTNGWTSSAQTITFTSDTAVTLDNVVVNVTKEVA